MRPSDKKWKMKDTLIIIICVVIIYLVLKPDRDETKEIFMIIIYLEPSIY